jgi:hypothetical protein
MRQFHRFINWRLCVARHDSGASTPIVGSVQLQWGPLVLPWDRGGGSVFGRGLAGYQPRPTAQLPPRSNGKARGCWCSCVLLMMGVEAPEACWATRGRQVMNFWSCCVWLVNLFESYDDARTCECQMYSFASTRHEMCGISFMLPFWRLEFWGGS